MNKISEGAREWETFKYDSFHIPRAVFNSPDRPIPFSSLSSSPDTGLTAFAQLGALRLNASRALISLFDRQHQYIVAEATRSMPLGAGVKYPKQNHLWLCGTAIPRAFGICEHVLVGDVPEPPAAAYSTGSVPVEDELPVAVVPDLAGDRRFCDRPYIDAAPYNRFYAGVPIRSPKGINIGVFCIFDDRPRAGLDADGVQFMKDISKTVMDYLDARRVNENYRRSERMVHGLGDFIGGNEEPPTPAKPPSPRSSSNSFDTPATSPPEAEPPSPKSSDVTDAIRPNLNPLSRDATESPTKVDSSDSVETTTTTSTVATTTSSSAPPDPRLTETIKIFTRAASVIHKSLEVDGALFLDASIGSYGGLVSGPRRASEVADNHFSSSEDSLSERPEDSNERWCKCFGRSSNMDGATGGIDSSQFSRSTLRERFLKKLLRRYPNGKVFNFDETGNWYLTESDNDDADITPTEESEQTAARPETKAAYSYFTRRNEAKTVGDMFPGARTVAVAPLWDPARERCFAGGFVWSKSASRILTPEADLPYLRAFGMVTMAEIARLDAIIADKAKTDILGSLSHELRSPLHGVVAAAELLHDTQLDAFQVDVIHTIEISGKTLLDSIDHLLDYSKVNTYLRASKSQRRNNGPGRGLRPETSASIESGMMTLVSDVHLDLLVEEVIESVFIGHSFQHMVASQLAHHKTSSGPPTPAQEKLDAIATSEGLAHRRNPSEAQPPVVKDVKILVDIDPDFSWVFHTQPGAIRRIIMNLFGNALKYTSKGFIKVNLRQEEVVHKTARSASMVVLTVSDSGKGISEDFLRNKLFTPFSQEDALAPGTGLGLSLVRQIVATLGGTISVKSQVGHGTSITVSIPLVLSRKAGSRGRKFSADLTSLSGRRLAVRGFSRGLDGSEELRNGGHDLPVESLPFKWLNVSVSDDNSNTGPTPADLMLCSEEAFRKFEMSEARGNEAPLVVVCSNAESAQKLATSYRRSRQQTVMEFIAQPTGPRKVAKALACALDRWQQRQAVKLVAAGPSSSTSTTHPPLPSPSALKSDGLLRPRAQSESIKTVRMSTSPAEIITQTANDSWRPQPDSNFTLTLPYRPAASVAAPATSTASATGNEFLLVDDNPINLKILSAYMKKLNKKHTTASNGLEALQTYTNQANRFCCILIDITMPVMDGLEATRRIRKFERAHHLPPVVVIAITSLGSANARQEGFASGMDLFLTRPVTMTELVKILRQRRLVDEEAEKEILPK
ncbi:Hybrid signal transduction protein dokA [Colletotrichum orbiculare MAFF 240422]|uniref:histidine kinase n=1 Tax=Colletotrichum orbiculare (strain 104-T / ATCC 96160 / CBS 514.97 / LARS 414 / MAFF 240422) TaxID=1213857 RepID=A0A484FV55_COLOR|nr:Hybrid signal transduction protein dokA [Colletotrichum orbiculare MAFF 240422]